MTALLRTAIVLAGLLLAVFSAAALADPQSQSFSSWKLVANTMTVRFTVSAREVTRLAAGGGRSELGQLLTRHLGHNIGVTADDAVCNPAGEPAIEASQPGYLVAELRFRCPANAGAVTLHNQAFFDAMASHVHFAKVALAGGGLRELLFTSRHRSHEFRLNSDETGADQFDDSGATVLAYISLGFEHILQGLDHIAFLLCLLILSARLQDIVLLVTGFTIGHSITLSLAVLGVVRPDIGLVEAMIGFTIALVAAENIAVRSGAGRQIALQVGLAMALMALWAALMQSGPPWLSLAGLALFSFCYLRLSGSEAAARKFRPLIAMFFGLVHGFGFANVLLEVGLPEGRVLAALFGFNVGVELGQIAIVLALWLFGLVFFTLFRTWNRQMTAEIASALLCAVGVYWFVQRAYFV